MSIYFGGSTGKGFMGNKNEDFIYVREIEKDILFLAVGDGSGSNGLNEQPARIAIFEIERFLTRAVRENRELFLENQEFFLSYAMQAANRILGAYRAANDALYSGIACSLTACIINGKNFTFAHCGNTRLYLMRTWKNESKPELRQLTTDFTEAKKLLLNGTITEPEYYTHPDRLKLTSGLGVFMEPEIQTLEGELKNNNLIVLCSDGIYNALRTDVIQEMIISAIVNEKDDPFTKASEALLSAAEMEYYPDNGAILIAGYMED